MIGKMVSHYRILEKLGSGGMGEVFLAHDDSLHRQVAIKFLPEPFREDETARKRFLREARSAAALDHPYICSIHAIGEWEGESFIVMEYVDGQTLKDRLAEAPVSLKETMEWATEISEALAVAHEKGIIHRDLKPSNIMLPRTGHAKIMDFGLAKQVSGIGQFAQQETTLTGLTREGTTLGTVPYMSPEQVQGTDVDFRSDLFSFGIVLYEMLARVNPFQKSSGLDTANAILRTTPPPISKYRDDVPQPLVAIIDKLLAKAPENRYQQTGDLARDLQKTAAAILRKEIAFTRPYSSRFGTALKKPAFLVPLILVITAGGYFSLQQYHSYQKRRWVREEALPRIRQLVQEWQTKVDYSKPSEAFPLAREAERYIPDSKDLKELWPQFTTPMIITTDPPGARIWRKPYSSTKEDWEEVGISPMEQVRIPAGPHRWKFEKEGFETVQAVAFSLPMPGTDRPKLHRVLETKGMIPDGMVRVVVDRNRLPDEWKKFVSKREASEAKTLDFYIDRYEITNAEYKRFIDSGGYRNRSYWKQDFLKNAKKLTWEEAMKEFVDPTGRPGPETWEAGDYPKGQEEYPVSGISWYEAAAYAQYIGKELPTSLHWYAATAYNMGAFLSRLVEFSNFGGNGPVRVGTRGGMDAFGAFDMAGNAREWCWNESPAGRCIRGGAWDDFTYMYSNVTQAPAFDRSTRNGFRCVRYIDRSAIPDSFFTTIELNTRDFTKETPVPDATFKVYRDQFSYQRSDLNVRQECKDDKSPDWIKEKASFDAAYGNDRVMALLFLPRKAQPPYQAVVYFPGSLAVRIETSEKLEDLSTIDFIVKSGRAVIYPIYYGTYERNKTAGINFEKHNPSRQYRDLYTELLIKWVRDLKRTVDFLEERKEIDPSRIAYYGWSWGGKLGSVMLASEERLKAGVLYLGGLDCTSEPRPEADEFNYTPRVHVPTLMLNGKYDLRFPLQISVQPMFDHLGTKDKVLVLENTDHYIPRTVLIKETLSWLDKYLGSVNLR